MQTHKLLLIVTVLLLASACAAQPKPAQVTEITSPNLPMKETGSTEPGDVLVEMTPIVVSDSNIEFEFAANTHSVDLNDLDLNLAATLKIGDRIYKPVKVPTLSGHHNSGKLVFGIADLGPEMTLTITGIPSVDIRTYTWILNS